ncbi:MAG: metallophosphoesterase family protein [Candidatus Dormibacteraeota bacterium]|nr:metallophosphoesterase family protein [Candidatus Dormibacteraeota bacterium]MBO0703936.1 metallophosphoesterase family protein [Candidatus Dormibacteraeota bacterium]MBO0760096.1 metallophosphoesterase family protein [Candidatus Dormibacteraeota bacterium]
MVRIGVIADTHCPEFLERVPDVVFEHFEGVDLILHGGDVGGPGGEETLRRLREIAPVEAVRGDHDDGLAGLPTRRDLVVAGRRIGLVHGNRSRLIEEPVTFLGTITLGLFWPLPGLGRWLRREFPAADLVVYGHTHRATARRVDGTLLFNPGAIYVVDEAEVRSRLARGPGWFEFSWLQVIRHRRDRPGASIGILELEGDEIRPKIIRL